VGGSKTVHAAKLGDKGFFSSNRLRKTHKYPNPTGVHRKLWKENRKVKKMVLGSDMDLEETYRMALCGLVDRPSYNYLSKGLVSTWIETNWVPILSYMLEVLFLTKGWLEFICKTTEDATILLSSLSVYGGSILMLKRWQVAFDPTTEHFQLCHLWVTYTFLE
jgi:hypothetical protein